MIEKNGDCRRTTIFPLTFSRFRPWWCCPSCLLEFVSEFSPRSILLWHFLSVNLTAPRISHTNHYFSSYCESNLTFENVDEDKPQCTLNARLCENDNANLTAFSRLLHRLCYRGALGTFHDKDNAEVVVRSTFRRLRVNYRRKQSCLATASLCFWSCCIVVARNRNNYGANIEQFIGNLLHEEVRYCCHRP